MKVIAVSVIETATYERTYLVADDFDVTDLDVVEELFTEDDDALTAGFASVNERDVTVTSTVHATADVYTTGMPDYDVDYT